MTAQAHKHLDLSYIESLIGDDNETKMVILSTLLEEVPQELSKMEELINSEDWKVFHEVSHKLKSTLAYLGNDKIFKTNEDIMLKARAIERLLEEKEDLNSPNIQSLAEEIINKLPSLKREWSRIEPEVNSAKEELENF
jgi:HPt (histidine-containing phosphotransfer) domain-containing protein